MITAWSVPNKSVSRSKPEYVVLEENPPRLRVTGITGPGISVDLEVELPAAYPDEPPKFSILATSGRLSDLDALQRDLLAEMRQSLGMAMVYTMVSTVEEWLARNMKPSSSSISTTAKTPSDGQLASRPTEEEVPLTMRGGPVTPETFAAWNTKFMAELSKTRMQQEKKQLEGSGPARLTGRELFEQNRALAASDSMVGDEVVLDSSAFEGLDDLQIDDLVLAGNEDFSNSSDDEGDGHI